MSRLWRTERGERFGEAVFQLLDPDGEVRAWAVDFPTVWDICKALNSQALEEEAKQKQADGEIECP